MPIILRRKAKNILEGSLNSALLAVEIYNKPRVTFRTESFITLMIIAWTRLFHSYFHIKIGSKYYFKKKNRYEKIEGEKKTWDLSKCIIEFNNYSNPAIISEAVKSNLKFFIGWRNKIEHNHVNSTIIDEIAFGECQSLLSNYENLVIKLYGDKFALNENLRFSIQFSSFRSIEQEKAIKLILSNDAKNIKTYIDNFRTSLPNDIFNSQEYSLKILLVPKISNTNKNDLAVEFIKLNELDSKDIERYENAVDVLIKDKIEIRDVVNLNRLKPKDVCKKVTEKIVSNFTDYVHQCFYFTFSVRPTRFEIGKDKADTLNTFCIYDISHNDYLYNQAWVDFIVNSILNKKLTTLKIKQLYKKKKKLKIENYMY